MSKKNKGHGNFRKIISDQNIQTTLSLSFTLVSVVCMVVMGLLMYTQFASAMETRLIEENHQLVNQITLNVGTYTRSMRRISDSMYYGVVKNADLSQRTLSEEMNLLYEANKDSLTSIACFTEDGGMVAAAPIANLKAGIDITRQEWFIRAVDTMENQHFSTPHVQNIFADNARYQWVISLSRVVELTHNGIPQRGVLLVDMNYSSVSQVFGQMTGETSGYAYLIDSSGEIIYHPSQKLIYSDIYKENNVAAAEYADGIHQETFEGTKRHVIVKTVGYTGWKVVSVLPYSEFSVNEGQLRLLVTGVLGVAIMLLVLVNSFVSSLIAKPIKQLEESVKNLDRGNLNQEIYVGGPYEIAHLGRTINTMVAQMRTLMVNIVRKQEEKQKSEFDALQAQINPHFLYNTLDSIVWMVESGRSEEAVSMVTALANFFRISLSKSKPIIPISAELQHARYYLYIQNIRYKDKFRLETNIDPEIENFYTIKLIIQPLLENAIYHAMEVMDGDGEIVINGYEKNNDIYIEVADNGLGMTQEKLASLLNAQAAPISSRKKGSGIGLLNVHQRIQLYYGAEYGLQIESKLDVGTTVRIHLPKALDDKPKTNITGGIND